MCVTQPLKWRPSTVPEWRTARGWRTRAATGRSTTEDTPKAASATATDATKRRNCCSLCHGGYTRLFPLDCTRGCCGDFFFSFSTSACVSSGRWQSCHCEIQQCAITSTKKSRLGFKCFISFWNQWLHDCRFTINSSSWLTTYQQSIINIVMPDKKQKPKPETKQIPPPPPKKRKKPVPPLLLFPDILSSPLNSQHDVIVRWRHSKITS